jgi:2-oxoglutarate ferredoxin oxidoreductase subunit gamma
MRTEIRFSGSGGQGLILASRIIAKAALIESKNVLQSQVYGAEARGGATKSEIIISDIEIFFPHIMNPDILLVMTEEAYKKYGTIVKTGGIRFIDSYMVSSIDKSDLYKTYAIPFTELAEKNFETKLIANMISIGFMSKVTKIVELDSITKTLNLLIKGENLKRNINAVKFGFELNN